MHDLQGEVRNF